MRTDLYSDRMSTLLVSPFSFPSLHLPSITVTERLHPKFSSISHSSLTLADQAVRDPTLTTLQAHQHMPTSPRLYSLVPLSAPSAARTATTSPDPRSNLSILSRLDPFFPLNNMPTTERAISMADEVDHLLDFGKGDEVSFLPSLPSLPSSCRFRSALRCLFSPCHRVALSHCNHISPLSLDCGPPASLSAPSQLELNWSWIAKYIIRSHSCRSIVAYFGH
jgi:hypothetical protein